MIPIPYSNLITRTNAQALIPEVVSDQILGGLTNMSAAMTMFPKINMSTNQTRMPILSALPTAYFVSGDTGLKQTTQVSWDNKYLNVEEIAAIVPIPENVFDDVTFDAWGNISPLLQNAIARTLDAAIFFGVNKPSSWPNAIAADAATNANTATRGTKSAANGGLAGDISAAFASVETDGFDISGLIANSKYKGMLRDIRDTQGRPLLDASGNVYGAQVMYPMRGLWPAVTTTGQQNVEMIGGDFSQGILGIRKDITYKILDQATIQDNTGAIQFNLAQQDMIALRVVFRCAFQVANTINYDNATTPGTTGGRYPFFSVLSPAN